MSKVGAVVLSLASLSCREASLYLFSYAVWSVPRTAAGESSSGFCLCFEDFLRII